MRAGRTLTGRSQSKDGASPQLRSQKSQALILSESVRQEEHKQEVVDDRPATTPHRRFPWVKVKAGQECDQLQNKDVLKKHGIPASMLLRHIERERKEEKDVKSLPWAILMLCSFSATLLLQERIFVENGLTSAVEFNIAENANFAFLAPGNMGVKNYQDVNNFADFWSWMGKGFIPLVAPQQVWISEGSNLTAGNLTIAEKQVFQSHIRKLAPIKLEQEVVDDVACPHKQMADAYGLACTTPPHNWHVEIEPTLSEVEFSSFREHTPKTVFLDTARTDLQQKLEELEAARWLDERSFHVKVTLVYYNQDDDLIGRTSCHFLFARSGRIWKHISYHVMKLDPYKSWTDFIAPGIFFVQCLWILLVEIYEVILVALPSIRGKKSADEKMGMDACKEYMNIWNMIDWFAILVSIALLCLVVSHELTLERIQAHMISVAEANDQCTSNCESGFASLHEDVQTVSWTHQSVRFAFAWCSLVVVARCFKAFSAQPRLAVVTVTLCKAATNLLHFLIVFAAIFMSYVVMGVAFFGREFENFAKTELACMTIFRSLLGDFDFEKLEPRGRPFAMLYFATCNLILMLVMLSVLIAIFMDVYEEVKAESVKSGTVWNEFFQIIARSWHVFRGHRLALKTIADLYRKNNVPKMSGGVLEDPLLQEHDLVEAVPGLSPEQAQELLLEAIEVEVDHHAQVEMYEIAETTTDVITELHRCRSHLLCPEAQKLAQEAKLEVVLKAAMLRIQDGRTPEWMGASGLLEDLLLEAQAFQKTLSRHA